MKTNTQTIAETLDRLDAMFADVESPMLADARRALALVEEDLDDSYNGWANYPTWAVNLWLSNDEPLYRATLDLARQALDDAPDDDNAQPREDRAPIWTVAETARFRLADTLKAWVTDELAPDLGASFAADLLGYALGEVRWDDIAEAWIEAASE